MVAADEVLPERVMATTDEDGAFSVALPYPTPARRQMSVTVGGGSAVSIWESGAPIEPADSWRRGASVSPTRWRWRRLTGGIDAALQALITPSAILAMVKIFLLLATMSPSPGWMHADSASTGGGTATTYARAWI